MPISNPSNSSSPIIVSSVEPSESPNKIGEIWFKSSTGQLWVSTGTSSVEDWVETSVDSPAVDLAIFDSILVADGQVVTDGANIVYR